MTCHSVQGISINEKTTIFDCTSPYVNRHYIWTALTRATSLDNVTIYRQQYSEKTIENRLKLHFKTKIDAYKFQDKKANRSIPENKDEYIDVKWIWDQLQNTHKCSGYGNHCCNVPFERYLDERNKPQTNISVDSLDNSISHLKTNCRLCCELCNKSKSNK